MIDAEQPTLRQLAKAGFHRTELWSRWEKGARVGMLGCGLGALATQGWPAYLLSIIALLLEGAALRFRQGAVPAQDLAEQAHRRALLVDALGETKEPLAVLELQDQFTKKMADQARSVDATSYYSSDEVPGLERLRDHLQESAFWSQHLYRKASTRAIAFVVIVILGVLVAALMAIPTAADETGLLVARILVLVLGFVVSVDALLRGLSWRAAAVQAGAVLRRLEYVALTEHEPCLAIFGDYVAATSTAPVIPNRLYAAERPRLNDLWDSYRAGRAQ